MNVVVETLLSIVVIFICYKWYKKLQSRQKMKWMTAVPGWPVLGNLFEFGGDSADRLKNLSRLISKYGKLIRVELVHKVIILCTDYDFVEFVLSNQNILNKASDYKFLNRWLGTGLLTSDGPKWKKRRRMTTPAFHFSILEQFIESFESSGEILIKKLEEKVGKDGTDAYSLITLYALDVICETAMGISINAQQHQDSDYVQNVKQMCKIFENRIFAFLESNDITYPLTADYYKELRIVGELHAVTNSVIDARKKEIENRRGSLNASQDDFGMKKRKAFLDILLQSTIDGQPLTREDIREEVDTFMFEGHDTTSSAISFAIYLLAAHPDVQKRALEEQKNIFVDDIRRNASINDLKEMKYLEMVIKETLRIYPSVPWFGRETNEDIEYKGNIIPKGTNILIYSYGVLNDPDNYKDPEKFDPSRFERSDGKRPYAFIPFSAGPRNCIGQKFAILEVKSALSKILRNFELLPTTPQHKLVVVSETVLKSRNGVRVRFAKRNW